MYSHYRIHSCRLKKASRLCFHYSYNLVLYWVLINTKKSNQQIQICTIAAEACMSKLEEAACSLPGCLHTWLLSRRILTMRTRLKANAQVWVSLFRNSSWSQSFHVTGSNPARTLKEKLAFWIAVKTNLRNLATFLQTSFWSITR